MHGHTNAEETRRVTAVVNAEIPIFKALCLVSDVPPRRLHAASKRVVAFTKSISRMFEKDACGGSRLEVLPLYDKRCTTDQRARLLTCVIEALSL